MKTGWLRGVALVSSLSIATLLVVRASGGCGGESPKAAASITPEASSSSGARLASAAAGNEKTAAPTAEPSQDVEEETEFGSTGKSGPVMRKPRRARQQPAAEQVP